MAKLYFRSSFIVSLALTAFAALIPLDFSGPAMPQGAVSEPVEFNFPPPLAVPAESDVRQALLGPGAIKPISPAHVTSDVLWMARAMYSETKRPKEQELVAWVVRNRLDTRYLGAESVRDVVLEPFQFSAFNPGGPHADFHANLDVLVDEPRWQRTLALAYYVVHADASMRPFAPTVRHFHSPQAMSEEKTEPKWAIGHEPVQPVRAFELDAERFRFFADID